MLRTEKRTKSFNVIMEEFNSIKELVDTSDNRKNNFGYNREFSQRWAGVKNYDQARDYLLNGWSEPIKDVKNYLDKIDQNKRLDARKTRLKDDIAGFLPIVPNALMGLPKSMRNVEIVTKKSKVLNVTIDTTYNAGVSKSEAQEYFSKVFAHLMALEKSGFRIRINSMMCFGNPSEDTVHIVKLLLKHEYQPIDIKKLMFPIINTAMLRAVGFDWYERLPDAVEIGGYGRALHHWHSTKEQEIYDLMGIDKSKSFYIHYNSNYRQIFKGAK